MPRALLASLSICLAACSAASARSAGAVGGGVFGGGSSLVEPVADDPVDRATVPTEGELRSRLAREPDPTAAGLELIGRLADEERHKEALFLADTLARRLAVEATDKSDPQKARAVSSGEQPVDVSDARQASLALVRIGLLRDLGRRHDAVATLNQLVMTVPPRQTHPALWFELAELRWLEGDRFGGRAALGTLLEYHAEHPWTVQRGRDIADLDRDLRESERPQRIRVRDLLGNLRGCPNVEERLQTFEELCSMGGGIKTRAETILLDDPDPMLRARATAQVDVAADLLAEFCAAGLLDPAPLVRAAAAGRADALPADVAASLLLPTMAVEQAPEAFRSMDAVLQKLGGTKRDLTTDAAADPAQRSAVLAEWRKRWER